MVLSYVAIGDSLTNGVGSSLFGAGFTQRYRGLAEEAMKTRIMLASFGRPGFETGDILEELDNKFIQEKITESDIITISAGGNDLINATRKFQMEEDEEVFMEAMTACEENYAKIMNKINLFNEKCEHPYIVRILNLYNPFPDMEIAVKWVGRFNTHIQRLAKRDDVKVADVHNAFLNHEQQFLSLDKIHPNDRGYRVIAEELDRLGYDGLK